MKILKINFFTVIVIALLNSSVALAWNDKITHPALTDRAIKYLERTYWLVPYLQNNLGFKNHFDEVLNNGNENKSIKDLLLEGSKEEDAPDEDHLLTRSSNHFHSPLKSTNEAGLDQGVLQGESALAWARGDIVSNEYSWFEARYHYKASFEAESAIDRDRELAKTFRCLGQIMHLVQDMAVPAHMRNGVA